MGSSLVPYQGWNHASSAEGQSLNRWTAGSPYSLSFDESHFPGVSQEKKKKKKQQLEVNFLKA